MQFRKPLIAVAAMAALAAPAAIAHRMWLLPSSTVLSGTDNWVTVDAAVSNDLFYFDHRPLAAVPAITQPDGSEGKAEHHAVGQFRATFDVHLTQQGTYRIAVVNQGVFGRYTLNGETRMIPRGTTKAQLASVIPAGATDVQTSEMLARNETFVTQGAPTTTVFKPSGQGIELVPVTHPNDLVANEPATFQFLLDGKPTAGLYVTTILGGGRYRAVPKPIEQRTDSQGKVTVRWPEAGVYWVNVTQNAPQPDGEGRSQGVPPARRLSYTTTLEVLAP